MKKVLITGISGGIGNAIGNHLAKNNNYKIYGTTTDISKIKDPNENISYLQVDFRDQKSIEDCINEISNVDILINCSGIVQVNSVEDVPIEKLNEIFEVNFFGAVKLIKGFIKGMREAKKGYIINIGSIADRFAIPFASGYVASKSALSGFTWSLRMELKKYGIKVVLVLPSDINTNMKSNVIIKEGSVYNEQINAINQNVEENMKKAPGPDKVAYLISKILSRKNPNYLYSVGRMAGLLIFLKKILSNKLIEKIILKEVGIT